LAFAWGVHGFTACGALAGAWALVAVKRGEAAAAVLLMLAGLFIDAVDGTLARRVGVRELLPHFDGRRLDDMVDFLNYAVVPAVFLVGTGLLPHPAWAAVALLASAYGFSQDDAKTEDDFFLGWPSYWNVFAIYAWLLGTRPAVNAALVALFALLVFVPWKYVYPTRMRVWRRTTCTLAALCAAAVAAAVLVPEAARSLHLVEISLLFPAWYVWLSLRLGSLHRRRA
jgi:phosphatidylcholine synthase